MSVNRHNPHLVVLPEDDANRQIALGFSHNLNLDGRAMVILPNAKGWKKVVDSFNNTHISKKRKYKNRMMLLLIDFDQQVERRLPLVQRKIPEDLKDRVFVLGAQSEPEKLKGIIANTFETIGKALAGDCANNTNDIWGHELLVHNKNELDRMISSVKPFLF